MKKGAVFRAYKLFAYSLPLLTLGYFLLFLTASVSAAPGINEQMNFQGRLLNAQGAVVPDGYYNVQFKIYEDGTGQAVGNPDGTLVWTESHLNSGSNGVRVKNGFISVQLGSINPFGSAVDWNNDTLWISMNVGNTNGTCADFSSCSPDGEMIPMKRLSATPYALNAGRIGGLTSSQFIQLAQGVQTDVSSVPSVQINKTGSGDFMALQADGEDAFALTRSGDILFGANADHSITIAQSATADAGNSITIAAGDAGDTSNLSGGSLILQGGAGNGTGESGSVIVQSNGSDSLAAFQVQDASSVSVFSVDTANKRVGIGTESPQYTLDIDGNLRIKSGAYDTLTHSGNTFRLQGSDTATSSSFLQIQQQTSGETYISGSELHYQNVETVTGNNSLVIGTGAAGHYTMDLRVDNGSSIFLGSRNGGRKVGIGTTAPSHKLHVVDGTGIVGQFSGRVIGGEAINTDEFTTLGQVNDLITGNTIDDYIQLQPASPGVQQTGNLNISGTAILGTSVLTSTLDTEDASAFSVGTTNATSIAIGKTSTTTTFGNNLTIRQNTGRGLASNVVVSSGDGGANRAAFFVKGGLTGNSFEAGGTSLWSSKVTTSAANVGMVIQGAASQTADMLQIQNSTGTNMLRIGANGNTVIQNSTNSTAAFQVQNAAGLSLFAIDSANNRVHIGNPTADGTGTILVFDAKNTAGDPTGVQGSMYFNSSTGKFRCYDDANWGDCGKLPKSAYFIDETEEQVIHNTIMEVWDGTKPNMTISNASDSVIVSVNLKGRGNGTDNESNVFTIHRAIDADPTCTSTRVGIYFGGSTQDDGGFGRDAPLVAVATFRDAPGAAGNVRYTICHDGTEAFSDANSSNINNIVESITFTLQESGV